MQLNVNNMNTKDIENYKPDCCKVGWYVKSRANFRCKKCEKDVTMEVVLISKIIDEK